jgi:rhodanese-related sulfurtransferase
MYEQQVRTMNIDELVGLMRSNRHYVLVDARSRSDYDNMHIPGALSIPVEEIRDYADKLDKEEEIVTYCGSYQCPASTMAAKELMKLGFRNVRDYKGGIKEWEETGYPAERSKQT